MDRRTRVFANGVNKDWLAERPRSGGCDDTIQVLPSRFEPGSLNRRSETPDQCVGSCHRDRGYECDSGSNRQPRVELDWPLTVLESDCDQSAPLHRVLRHLGAARFVPGPSTGEAIGDPDNFTQVSSTSRLQSTPWRHGLAASIRISVNRCIHRNRVM